MGRLPTLTVGLAFLLLPAAGMGAPVETVRNICRGSEEKCLIYYSGLVDGLYLANVAAKVQTGVPLFCPPQTTTEAVATVIRLYVDSHPARWHETTAPLALSAVKEAYPCP